MVSAAAPYFGVSKLPIIGDLQTAAAYYALAIVSFMAGTQWGLSLSKTLSENTDLPSHSAAICPKKLMLASNASVLLPWLVICIMGVGVSFYFVVALVLIFMVFSDFRLMNRNYISSHYYRFRLIATAIVVVCLVSLAFTVTQTPNCYHGY